MVQIFADILFFYVFGLGAIALTWYLAITMIRYFREQKTKQNKGNTHDSKY